MKLNKKFCKVYFNKQNNPIVQNSCNISQKHIVHYLSAQRRHHCGDFSLGDRREEPQLLPSALRDGVQAVVHPDSPLRALQLRFHSSTRLCLKYFSYPTLKTI